MTTLLAHGIGGIRDLPVPRYVFFYGAAGVLLISFVALAVLWRKPVLADRAGGRPLPSALQRFLLSNALRILLGALSFAVFVFLWLGALIGNSSSGVNFTPTFVYVYFWIGMVLVVVLLGDVWSVLSPWKAAADGAGWVMRRLGLRDGPAFEYPERFGRWPAAVLLLSFAAMELWKQPRMRPAKTFYPRVILLYPLPPGARGEDDPVQPEPAEPGGTRAE